jgi:hypothetical protein
MNGPPETPVYGISLSQTETRIFPDAIFGYPAQTAKTVTITNTGDQPTGALTLKVSNDDFTLNKQTIDNIAVGAKDSFKAESAPGLAEGTHTATVTVSRRASA